MDLSVIIVNYNTIEDLKRCLSSLESSWDGLKKEIIVVDNASQDGSADYVENNYAHVKIVRNNKNEGLSKANNIGAAVAQSDFLLFLNPDTVVQGDTLKVLLDFLKSTPDAGVLGPKLVYPDGTLQLSCRSYYSIRALISRRTFVGRLFPNSAVLKNHLLTDWDHETTRKVDWVLGACLMMSRGIFEKVGRFDEKYKLYFEDVDLCRRINESGYGVYYAPFASIVHHHRRDSAKRFNRVTLWHIQSAIRFFNKHGWVF